MTLRLIWGLLIMLIAFGPGSAASAQAFVHPGGLHTMSDLDRMKAKVAAGAHPWIDGWDRLISDPKAQNTYTASPQANMGVSRQRAQDDATSAYLNAIRWYISGDTSYADCAVRNLNGWSAKVDQVPHGVDQPGLGGIPIGNFALAAEVLRVYPGWKAEDQARFKNMLLTYFYPACNSFLTNHNNGCISRYWANWDTANILAVMAIGVYCDDREKFNQGVDYFKTGAGNGSIKNAVVNMHPGDLGQWQESGRDQAHALGGMGLLAEACQVAWNQGIDLFGYSDNRLLAAAEYTAQYTLQKGVPYTYYNNCDNANQFYISANYHGRLDNCQYFELLYNHYVVLRGLNGHTVRRFAEVMRPEGGNADIFGYGTLTYTLSAAASPYPASPVPPVPLDLSATAGIGQISLKWSPSGAYSAQGYSVMRSASSGGPFTTIFSTTKNTSPLYMDSNVVKNTPYFYSVAAINQAGTSANSAVVSATPVAGSVLPAGWIDNDLGKPTVAGSTVYAGVAGNSFIVTGEGAGIGGSADSCHLACRKVTGDFTITARLTENSGTVSKSGLMMRESLDAGAAAVSMTLGDLGGRFARMGTRSEAAGRMSFVDGDQYTWIPVWFRLERTGNTFTASQSSDGSTWFKVGTSTVPMAATYLVGLAATSGSTTGALAKARFENVITEVAPPLSPSAPTGLKATASSGGNIKLTWRNNASDQNGFKIECSSDNVLFYEIADLRADATRFINTGMTSSLHYYRVRAYNTGGYSAYSNTATTNDKVLSFVAH